MALRTSLTTSSIPFPTDRQSLLFSKIKGKASFWGRRSTWARDLAEREWGLRQQLDKYLRILSSQMLVEAWGTDVVLHMSQIQESFLVPSCWSLFVISSSLTKDIWATVDRYTVVRHQWLCAKKASCGKTPNPIHVTGNALLQQGKIRLQEFLGFFYISTYPTRFPLTKPKRKAVLFSYLCLTGYIQVRQVTANKAIYQRQNFCREGNSRLQITLHQRKYSKGLLHD